MLWHSRLSDKHEWYRSWHDHSGHHPLHWGIFIFIGILATSQLIGQIDETYSEHPEIQRVVASAGGSGEHDYFNQLVAHPAHWKSYSLRSMAQLQTRQNGGYANCNSCPLAVTYDPANDPHPNRQDAAKVVIPAFNEEAHSQLIQPLSPTDMEMHLSDKNGDVTRVSTSFNVKGRQIKIGDEVVILNENVTPLDRATGIVTLSQRGAYGTTPSAHPVGTGARLGGNSLSNQVRVPVDTHDDATWLITWDGYFTDSFMNTGLSNYKTFQLSSPNDNIWIEPQTTFSGGGDFRPAEYDRTKHVAVTGRVRSYNRLGGAVNYADNSDDNYLGPGVTRNQPVLPVVDEFFILHPNRWTRWWVLIDQRANDYDLFSLWMADEQNNPRQIYNNIPVSVREKNGGGLIDKFWLEFNTSTSYLPEGRTTDFRDLVAYVKNIVVLKNPPEDVSSILQRPGAGGTLPPYVPPPSPTPDTTAPTVSLTAPANGATVSGTVTVSATATDNVGVTGVQFKLDGVNLGSEDTTSPYSISWNTTQATNGTKTLTAVARDAAGNTTTSASRTVTVSNTVTPPTDTTAPSTPSNLQATAVSSTQINLTWTASTDNVAVTGYSIYRNGTQIATAITTTSYQDTGRSPSTTYSYTVRAYDDAGNISSHSSSVNATTQAPPAPPVVIEDTPPPPPTTSRPPSSGGSSPRPTVTTQTTPEPIATTQTPSPTFPTAFTPPPIPAEPPTSLPGRIQNFFRPVSDVLDPIDSTTEDSSTPRIQRFAIENTESPKTVRVNFEVSKPEGAKLWRAYLFRAEYQPETCDETNKSGCDWKAVENATAPEGSEQWSTSLEHKPAPGTHWYSFQVIDRAGNRGFEEEPVKIIKPESPFKELVFRILRLLGWRD